MAGVPFSPFVDPSSAGLSTETKLALILDTLDSPSPRELRSLVVEDGRSAFTSLPSNIARRFLTVLLERLVDMSVLRKNISISIRRKRWTGRNNRTEYTLAGLRSGKMKQDLIGRISGAPARVW